MQLSNNLEAFIVRDNKGFPDRPLVRVLYDEKGAEIEPYDIDLLEQLDIRINSVL